MTKKYLCLYSNWKVITTINDKRKNALTLLMYQVASNWYHKLDKRG